MTIAPIPMPESRTVMCAICGVPVRQELEPAALDTPIGGEDWVCKTPCLCDGVIDTAKENT